MSPPRRPPAGKGRSSTGKGRRPGPDPRPSRAKGAASGRQTGPHATRARPDDAQSAPARRRDHQHALGGEQVEGRHAVLELLRANARPVRELWIAEGLESSPQLDDIERLARHLKVKTLLVPRRRFDSAARTEAAQGVLAHAQALKEAELDSMASSTRRGPPLLLVLDGVTDPHNLGSLLRSADGAGVTGVVVARHRAAHVTPTVAKVAAGAIEHVPIAVVPGIPAALARLTQLGVISFGLDPGSPVSIYDDSLGFDGPLALVLGAEGRGLGTLSAKRCTTLVSIPRRGALQSLNVSIAGAVVCFEVARRRRMH